MVMGAYTGAGAPPPGIQVRHSAAVSGCLPVLSYASCTAWPHFASLPRMMSEDVSTSSLTVNPYSPSGPKRTAGPWAANLHADPCASTQQHRRSSHVLFVSRRSVRVSRPPPCAAAAVRRSSCTSTDSVPCATVPCLRKPRTRQRRGVPAAGNDHQATAGV